MFGRTAPEGSVTVPEISPVVVDWAKRGELVSITLANATSNVNNINRLKLMLFLREINLAENRFLDFGLPVPLNTGNVNKTGTVLSNMHTRCQQVSCYKSLLINLL